MNLPIELVEQVALYVDRSCLLSLALVNSSMNAVALRLLYRHIHATTPDLVTVLADRPALAHCVRTLRVTMADTAKLACALSAMSQLRQLELSVPEDSSFVLANACCPNLTRFAATFALDSHVFEFIARSPLITELELDSLSLPVQRPLQLAHLVHFAGSSHIANLIHNASLQSVHITSGELSVALIDALPATVSVLAASTSLPPIQLLHKLAKSLPCLIYLRVLSTYTFQHLPDFENIANALADLQHLEAFELSGMHWDHQRVWQSKPLDVVPHHDDVASDLFYQY